MCVGGGVLSDHDAIWDVSMIYGSGSYHVFLQEA